MTDIKDYRNSELKNYVIGNILLVLYFSGMFSKIFSEDVNSNLDIWSIVIESALISSIIYIYVFLLDSMIPGNIKQKIAYFHIGKLPGYTIFTKMKQSVRDDRFTQADVMQKYNQIYANMPTDRKEREKYENAQWYRLYRDCKNENKILIANRDFLLCRDITIITLMLLIIYMMLSCLKIMMFSKIIVEIMGVELIVSNISMRGKAKRLAYNVICNGVQREHNKKLNNGLPILHKVPPKRDYGRYFCIMAEKGGTSHGGLTEKLSPFFHAKKQEVNAYGR